MDSLNPCSDKRFSMLSARSGSSMMALSVISRQKELACSPWLTKVAPSRVLSSGSIRSRVDRLTEMRSAMPLVRESANRRAVSSNIHSVRWRTKPVCSANGINSIGGIKPRLGCCQRTKASAAKPGLPNRGTLGCRNRRNSPCSTARRNSVSSDKVWVLVESNEGEYSSGPSSLRLATYMAISEWLSRVSASAASTGQQAMPMPALKSTVCSSKASGTSNDAAMRRATSMAVGASAPCNRTENSLPPRRATMSPGCRTSRVSRSATACSSLSPNA